GGPRAAELRDDHEPRAVGTRPGHPPPGGRTQAVDDTSRARPIAPIGDGGRSDTVTRPPERSNLTASRAQPGSAASTAGATGLPATTAIAPASAAPSARSSP